MQAPDDLLRKIVSPSQVSEWRHGADRSGKAVAVVGGSFDLLQPGNLLAIREASAQGSVCVVLEPDETVLARSRVGRSCHSLEERAEMVAHLRAVSAVTSFAPDRIRETLGHLRPFVWVSCAAGRTADGLGEAALAEADGCVHVPRLSGCSTEEIHEAVRQGRTPISVDEAFYPNRRESAGLSSVAGAGNQLVTVNGCFDILHIGHLRLLQQARAMGEALIMAVNDDDSVRRYKGPTRPVFPLRFRLAALEALHSVSGVLAFAEDQPLQALAQLKPRTHVKGGTYEEDRVRQERDLLESWGGRIAFCPMVAGYSTSEYIRKVLRPGPA
jgi:rfaE bifunctional protein nucleotidyltransferase chain/domain